MQLRTGRLAEMEEIARLGLANSERSGNPRDELAARWSLVLLVSGQDAAGYTACREAAELYARKGNLIGAARARSLLERRLLG